jgi:hypothetical protein
MLLPLHLIATTLLGLLSLAIWPSAFTLSIGLGGQRGHDAIASLNRLTSILRAARFELPRSW